jgi:glycosyltransferase involved in cell wall biosynthesis
MVLIPRSPRGWLSKVYRRPPPLAEAGSDTRPLVIVFGAQPPPINGMSVINAEISKILELSGCRLLVNNISPGSSHGFGYHIRRGARVLTGVTRIAAHRREARRALYAAVDSGWGILYTIAAVAVARMLGFRLALHYHSSDYVNRRRQLCCLLTAIAGRDAVHILASSSMASRFAATYVGARRFLPVHNAAFVTCGPPPCANPDRPLTLGLLSNLSRAKGLDAALQTALSLLRYGHSCRLVLAGPLADAEAEAAVARARFELGDRLELYGPVANVDKARFFANIDVFLFASTYKHETQSLVVPEAMAHSVPVIAYAHGFIAELITDGGGVLLPPGSDFSTCALPVLSRWAICAVDRLRAGALARERFLAFRQQGTRELEALLAFLTDTSGIMGCMDNPPCPVAGHEGEDLLTSSLSSPPR